MLTLFLSLALSSAAPDAATAAPPATPDAAGSTKPAKPKKICQKVETTGRTVPKRVCRIIAEPAQPAPDAARAETAAPTGGRR